LLRWRPSPPNGKEEVRVCRFNNGPGTGGVLAVPTEEELAKGRFYKDVAEYSEDHGLRT
jgi:hypothetical protein